MGDLTEALNRLSEFRVHPLGFHYLQDDFGDGFARRIHVWIECGLDVPEKDCHSHAYDIDSLIVIGTLHSELYHFVEKDGGAEVEFRVGYDAGKSMLTPTGRRGALDPIASFETAAGSRYRLEAGIIHRATVIERPCVTVLRTRHSGVPIFAYGDGGGERPFSRGNVEALERDSIANALKRASACRA
jgi:hypothetical protein